MFIILKRSWSRVLLILMGSRDQEVSRMFLIMTEAGSRVFLILMGSGGQGVSDPDRELGAGCF